MKYKHGTKEYWMDWYWNRGGREKVQAKRYIREYERERQKRKAGINQSGGQREDQWDSLRRKFLAGSNPAMSTNIN